MSHRHSEIGHGRMRALFFAEHRARFNATTYLVMDLLLLKFCFDPNVAA